MFTMNMLLSVITMFMPMSKASAGTFLTICELKATPIFITDDVASKRS